MAHFPPVQEQIAILTRGIVDLHTPVELEQRLTRSLQTGKPLRVKAGFDPTRPDLHFGHAVLLNKLRQFQDCGHTVILLIGEFTATVGDPTGQNELRPRLSREEVNQSAKTYTEQAFTLLDRPRVELRSNAEWLDRLNPSELVALMAKMTVARMLERNDFAQRFHAQKPIFQHEFLYPLLQGYDSVALQCDLELGGTDQLFNLLVGRDLMTKYGQEGQMVMTTPLLEGTDARMDAHGQITGKKMSKSADNFIGIQEEPLSMYRKIMQVDDHVIFRYFDLLSSRSTEEIARLMQEQKEGRNPMEIKALFAQEMVERFHGRAKAQAAVLEFSEVYGEDALPNDIIEHTLTTRTDTLWIAKALSASGLVQSTAEGKRLVEQGGVQVDRVRIRDAHFQLERGKRYLLRVGSKHRKFAYITVSP